MTMADILRHKLICGKAGEATGNVGRVHIDNACVTLENQGGFKVLGQLTECYGCPLQTLWQPSTINDHNNNASFQVRIESPQIE